MSSKKFEDLIKRKQDLLAKVRKEREQLQTDKNARSVAAAKETLKTKYDTFEDINKVCLTLGAPPLQNTTFENNTCPKKFTSNTIKPSSDSSVTDGVSDINKKLSKLSLSATNTIDIQPERILKYTKSTQTNISRVPLTLVIPKYDENEDEYSPEGGFASRLPPGCMSPGLPQLHFVEPAITLLENIQEEPIEVKALTEEEKQSIISSKKFQRTLKRLGCVMEKFIAKNVNFTKDYIKGIGYEDEEDAKARGRVSLNHIMVDSQWSKQRCVTSMDWSSYYPEMMVASYHSNENAPLEPEGIVIVWNTKSKRQTAEYIFHSPSAVTATCFAKYNPNIVLGGTYSGQIVVWDNRSPTPIPVQSTTLNCGAHLQPIHSIKMIGTESSHSLITISSDGKLCSWSLDMLSEPVETVLLEKSEKRPVASTCLAFSEDEASYILVGSEDGFIYSASRLGFNAGINGRYGYHEGPITGIAMHNNEPNFDFQNLFLTSSMDCTIKMWSLNSFEPIHTFKENCDYVMDIAWAPLHPAIFAAIDGSGRFDLWNLNMDTEAPTVSLLVNGQPVLNHLTWSPNGQSVALGDLDGNIFLYDIVDSLVQPLPGESSVFESAVKNLM